MEFNQIETASTERNGLLQGLTIWGGIGFIHIKMLPKKGKSGLSKKDGVFVSHFNNIRLRGREQA